MLKGLWTKEYFEAEKEEFQSLKDLDFFELVERSSLLPGAKWLMTRWVYADKIDKLGDIYRFKARLTAMGCFQREGIDYIDSYASVCRTKTIRMLLALYNSDAEYSMEHWDRKNSFVNAPIDVDIWMEQPAGHVIPGKERMVYKLNRSIYGLVQSSRNFKKFLASILAECGADHLPMTIRSIR